MRHCGEEIRNLSLQRAVAAGALKEVRDARRREALEHYLGMLDYVTEMLLFKRRLTMRALFQKGARARGSTPRPPPGGAC